MSFVEEISKLLRNGCDDALLDYIYENYDEIDRELNGDEYRNPKSTIVIFALTATWKR